MKKKLFSLIMVACMFAFPFLVSAAEVEKVGTEETLRAALESGKSVELTADIEIKTPSTKADGTSTGVALKGEGNIVVDGKGHKIYSSDLKKIMEVHATGEGANVTITDVEIVNSRAEGRVLDTRTGNLSLILDDVTFSTTGAGNTQVLTVGGNYTGANDVKIINSTLKDGIAGYGIVTFNKVNLTIDNSEVSAYGALYMKGINNSAGSAGSVVTVKNNSVLSTDNVHSALSNAFATVIFEDKALTMNVENSTVKAVSTGEQPQYAFSFRKENCKATFSGNSVIEVDTVDEFASGGELINLTLNKGISSNVEIPTEYLAKVSGTEESTEVYEVVNIETGESKYVVATEAELENKVFEDEESVMNAEEFEEALKELEESEYDEDKELLAELKKALEGKTTVSAHNILYGSFIEESLVVNSIQSELEKAVKVTLNVPETLEKVKNGYNRKYSVIRLHWDQDTQKMVVDVLDAKENKDGTVTFETDKFSTYILTYEDVKDTTNPNTFDGISSIMVVACLSLVSLLAVALYAKNNKVFN